MYSQPIKNAGKAINPALKLNLLLTELYKVVSKAKKKLFTTTEAKTPIHDAFFTHHIVEKLNTEKNKYAMPKTCQFLHFLVLEILSSRSNKGTKPIMAPGIKSKGAKLEAIKTAPRISNPIFLNLST